MKGRLMFFAAQFRTIDRRWALSLIRQGIVLLLAALLIAFSPSSPAYAASITVTTTADTIDAAASCAAVTLAALPGPDGQTSLREALCAANSNANSDIVTLSVNPT